MIVYNLAGIYNMAEDSSIKTLSISMGISF